MKQLTEKQKDFLAAIEAGYIAGNVPTVYELAEKFNIKTSTVFAHIKALERKGKVCRTNKARSIEPMTVMRVTGKRKNKLIFSSRFVCESKLPITEENDEFSAHINAAKLLSCDVVDFQMGIWVNYIKL